MVIFHTFQKNYEENFRRRYDQFFVTASVEKLCIQCNKYIYLSVGAKRYAKKTTEVQLPRGVMGLSDAIPNRVKRYFVSNLYYLIHSFRKLKLMSVMPCSVFYMYYALNIFPNYSCFTSTHFHYVVYTQYTNGINHLTKI